MMKSLTVYLAILASAVSAAPRSEILPVITCADDSPYPQVIFAPSEPGLNLDPNQYVICIRGEPLIFTCAKGLFFNWSVMTCDFPYERRSNDTAGEGGEFDGELIPAGPIPVPVSPDHPIPIRVGNHHLPFPIPPVLPFPRPETKPNPSVIRPIPVLPAHPPPLIPRPVPYQ